jgi:hypothetical protein
MVAVEHRCQDIPVRTGLERHPPQGFARGGVQSQQALARHGDGLMPARQGAGHQRGVAGEIVLGFPEEPARVLVEGRDARPVGRTDLDEDPLARDHRGAGIAPPVGGSGSARAVFDPEHAVIAKVEAPLFLAAVERQAGEFTQAALDVDPIALDQRCAARTGFEFVGERLGEGL